MRKRNPKAEPPHSGSDRPHGSRRAVPSYGQPPRAGNRPSLSEVAYGRLSDMLRNRNLKPNDLINERHLARELNVSRTPLREAIRRLEGERILERQSSGILVVRPISIEDLLYICQVRRLIEGEAARRAAGRIPVADLSACASVILVSGPEQLKCGPQKLRPVAMIYIVSSRKHAAIQNSHRSL